MYKIVFSATGRCEKVADAFCSVFENVEKIDLSGDADAIEIPADELCLIAASVYGGCVPAPAVDNLLKIKGAGAKAVIMAVYGNRDYDDALTELKAVCETAGFTVVGAVAAVAQHSLLPAVAAHRPDAEDEKQLKAFAEKTAELTEPMKAVIKGKITQGAAHSLPVHPKTTKDCVKCGICAAKCPAKAISMDNPQLTQKDSCITCMRCVEICPQNARVLLPAVMRMANPIMKKVWGKHTENEFYL